MNLKSKSGFSLIELMVVVAIIGILATIAVPNFQRFQARTKQTNAKVELSGIYTAQKAFKAEYDTYQSDLPLMGFMPDGVENNGIATATSSRIYSSSTSGLAAVGTAATALGTLNLVPSGWSGYFGARRCHGTLNNANNRLAQNKGMVARDNFTAIAVGCPLGEANPGDTWTMDQNRVLKNTVFLKSGST